MFPRQVVVFFDRVQVTRDEACFAFSFSYGDAAGAFTPLQPEEVSRTLICASQEWCYLKGFLCISILFPKLLRFFLVSIDCEIVTWSRHGKRLVFVP